MGLLLKATAFGVPDDNPYHTILLRNPFGLNPPVVQPTNTPVEPPRTIKFNGITMIRGNKKAFFTILGKDPKEAPKYVSLSETERADFLEVTKIFRETGEVEIVNSGVKMVLNFKNNGNQPDKGIPQAVAQVPIAPSSAGVVYNPGGDTRVASLGQPGSPLPAGNGGIVPNSGPMNGVASLGAISGVVYQPAMTASRGSAAAQTPANIDPAQQRLQMLAEHAAQTAAYERGEGATYYKPQTDPKVFSPNGVMAVQKRIPPPLPLPPGVQ